MSLARLPLVAAALILITACASAPRQAVEAPPVEAEPVAKEPLPAPQPTEPVEDSATAPAPQPEWVIEHLPSTFPEIEIPPLWEEEGEDPATVRRADWLAAAREALEFGMEEEAETAYLRALESLEPADPQLILVTDELALLYEGQGRFAEAIGLLTSLPQPHGHSTRRRLALAYEGQGLWLDAVQSYQALIGESDDIEAEELQARLRMLVSSLTEDQLLTLSGVMLFEPLGGYATLKLARLRVDSGRDREALPLLARLQYLYPDTPLGERAARLRLRAHARLNVKPGHFGLLLPLSGPLAPFGKRVLDGALLGSELLLAGSATPVVFHVADSKGDPDTAARGVEKLAAQGAIAIAGPLKGDASADAARVARELELPMVALTPSRQVAGGTVMRLHLREEDEVDRLARHAIRELGLTRFAILAPDDEQGRLYRKLFWDAVVRYGGEIAGSQLFPVADNPTLEVPIEKLTGIHGLSKTELSRLFTLDRIEEVEEVKAVLREMGISQSGAEPSLESRAKALADFEPDPNVDFQAVFLPVSSLTAAQLAPQLPYYDVSNVIMLGIRSWNYSALTKIGKEYVEGARFPVEWHPATPEGEAFAAAFRESYGRAPGVLEAYGYDAAALLVKAWREGKGAERAMLGRHLSNLWATGGVTGPHTAHPGGDIAVEPKILAVQNRRIVPDWPQEELQ